jgi:sporulation-control protein
MKRLLASIGIGSAKVDTIVHTNEIEVGTTLNGEVEIYGGDVAQAIDKIDLELYTYVERDGQNFSYRFGTANISASLVAEPHTKKVIPFTLDIPHYTPISAGGYNRVWLNTSLDIKNAIDPTDTDHLNIVPNSAMFDVFESIEELGFSLNEVDIENSNLFEWGFIQEFEFRPRSRRGKINEVEIIFLNKDNELDVYLQKDAKVGGTLGMFEDILDLNEKMYHFYIPTRGGKSQIAKQDIKSHIEKILL